MARVALLSPDLLFGFKVAGGLGAAGHEVTRYARGDAARAAATADVLVVDLTVDDYDGAGLVDSLRRGGHLGPTRTLGFYSHVDQETRRRADGAGFDLVVPRSRMAREMGTLVERLLAGGEPAARR